MTLRVPTAAEAEVIAQVNAKLEEAGLPTYTDLVQLAIGAVGFVRTCQDLAPATSFAGRLAAEVIERARDMDDL